MLFDKEDAHNPINRRISIVVMTKEAEEAARSAIGNMQDLAAPPAEAEPEPEPAAEPAPADLADPAPAMTTVPLGGAN